MTSGMKQHIMSRIIGMDSDDVRRLKRFTEDRKSERCRFIHEVATEDLLDRLGDQRRVYKSDIQQPHQEF